MYEFWRYTLLVLVGLASMMVMFISLALSGALVASAGEAPSVADLGPAYWVLGLSALYCCLWLTGDFCRRIPRLVLSWLSTHKDQLTATSVIMVIFLVFIVS